LKYKITLLEAVSVKIAHLPPPLKQRIREAFDLLCENPFIGQPWKDNLMGLWRYRVSTYRIVYRIHLHEIEVVVIAVGPRSNIYDDLTDFA